MQTLLLAFILFNVLFYSKQSNFSKCGTNIETSEHAIQYSDTYLKPLFEKVYDTQERLVWELPYRMNMSEESQVERDKEWESKYEEVMNLTCSVHPFLSSLAKCNRQRISEQWKTDMLEMAQKQASQCILMLNSHIQSFIQRVKNGNSP